ncbi:hypothetical protein M758_4G245300 [Ceratodon purpureus]|uniref:Uncharacterized protein n=1 Tax=Ceratodon purpureus TaxID=3225 RepID=A0A8T0IFJ3_CERPU|nr:hypothetical protein KC19_4G240800 [Ceratodon purpureus]KAG0620800.1 hypothetical protein M758_4G245300 [Ceratodon purpureus]
MLYACSPFVHTIHTHDNNPQLAPVYPIQNVRHLSQNVSPTLHSPAPSPKFLNTDTCHCAPRCAEMTPVPPTYTFCRELYSRRDITSYANIKLWNIDCRTPPLFNTETLERWQTMASKR